MEMEYKIPTHYTPRGCVCDVWFSALGSHFPAGRLHALLRRLIGCRAGKSPPLLPLDLSAMI